LCQGSFGKAASWNNKEKELTMKQNEDCNEKKKKVPVRLLPTSLCHKRCRKIAKKRESRNLRFFKKRKSRPDKRKTRTKKNGGSR